MGYSKSFKELIKSLAGQSVNPEIVKAYTHVVDSATCCGVKELTQLEHLKAYCERLKVDFRSQLALILDLKNRPGYTLHYFNVDCADKSEMGLKTIVVLDTLKEFGFIEFTRFINANYRCRGGYKNPMYTVGLELIPDFEFNEDEDTDEDNQ